MKTNGSSELTPLEEYKRLSKEGRKAVRKTATGPKDLKQREEVNVAEALQSAQDALARQQEYIEHLVQERGQFVEAFQRISKDLVEVGRGTKDSGEGLRQIAGVVLELNRTVEGATDGRSTD